MSKKEKTLNESNETSRDVQSPINVGIGYDGLVYEVQLTFNHPDGTTQVIHMDSFLASWLGKVLKDTGDKVSDQNNFILSSLDQEVENIDETDLN